MTPTMQVLMSVFTVAGFIIAKVHTILSSPVGRDVMRVLEEAANQHQKVQAHGKLSALTSHGAALFKDLASIRHAVRDGAAKGEVADPELDAVLAQAKELYLAKKQK